jgi:predicted CXXCH cytochrome family protein
MPIKVKHIEHGLTGLICLFFLIILAIGAKGASIVNSKHDLSYLLTVDPVMSDVYNQYNEVCVYCHTPHSAHSSIDAPLWNRNTPTGPYTLYNSSTMDNPPGSVSDISLVCLSCHDGTIAVDEIINAPGPGANLDGPWYGFSNAPIHYKMGTPLRIPNCAFCHGGLGIYQPRAGDHRPSYLTTDLSDDHPISTTYPTPAQDPYFKTPAEVNSAGLKLYNNKVECPSCHNVHKPDNVPFLRKNNSGSELCTACHDK